MQSNVKIKMQSWHFCTRARKKGHQITWFVSTRLGNLDRNAFCATASKKVPGYSIWNGDKTCKANPYVAKVKQAGWGIEMSANELHGSFSPMTFLTNILNSIKILHYWSNSIKKKSSLSSFCIHMSYIHNAFRSKACFYIWLFNTHFLQKDYWSCTSTALNKKQVCIYYKAGVIVVTRTV